jgi:hypothetical protein
MKGLTLVFGGPKAGKGGGGEAKPPGAEGEGSGMSGKTEAAKAVMQAVKMGEVGELESALTAFVEACGTAGYSDKE